MARTSPAAASCPPVSGPECHKPRYPRDTCIHPSSLTFRVSLSLSSYAAAMAAAMAAAIPLDRTAGPFAVPNAFAANDTALPLVPRASTPLKFSNEVPSRIIKGMLATLRRAPRGPVLGQDIRGRRGGRLRILRERRHRHLRHRTGGVRLRTVRAHHRRSVEIGQDFARR